MSRKLEGIVIHRTEAGRTGAEVKAVEAEQGFGYHYFVGPDGKVEQLYPDEVMVWHARKWSKNTIAVGVFGDFHPPDRARHNMPTLDQWVVLVALCKSLVVKYGFLFIMGHTDLADATSVADKVCPGVNLDVRQLGRDVYGASVPMA